MKWVAAILLAILLVGAPESTCACGRGGSVSYNGNRSFIVDEKFLKCAIVVLREETTIKLLKQSKINLVDKKTEEIVLKKVNGKWAIVVKTTILTDKGPIFNFTNINLDSLEVINQNNTPLGKILRSASSIRLTKHGNKTMFVLYGETTIWRKFPNLFKRKAAAVAGEAIQKKLCEAQNLICQEVERFKDTPTILLFAEEVLNILHQEGLLPE